MTTIPPNIQDIAAAAKLSLLEVTPQDDGYWLAEYDICDLARLAAWTTYRERLARAGGTMAQFGVNLEQDVIQIRFLVAS